MTRGKTLIAGLGLVLTLASCTGEPGGARREEEVQLDVFCRPSGTASRSSFSGDADALLDWNLYAYLGGTLYAEVYSGNASSIRLLSGRRYDFYVLANVGEVHAPADENDIDLLTYRINGLIDFNNKGFPMAYVPVSGFEVTDASSVLYFPLTRLVARYDFSIDRSLLENLGFTATSLSLRQSPLDIRPFALRSSATETGDCDHACAEDVRRLNAGDTVSFYMLENWQGQLCNGNTDEWQKFPDGDAVSASLSTYIELEGRISAVGLAADASYRMYLGRDNTGDFNVVRGTVNSVRLTLTDKGSFRTSWKVTLSNISDSRMLRFEADTIYVYRDFLGVWTRVLSNPEGVAWYVEGDPAEMSAGQFQFTTSLNTYQRNYAYLYEGVMPLIKSDYDGDGEPGMKLRLYSWDGLLQDETWVVARNRYYHIDFLRHRYTMAVGDTLDAHVMFLPSTPNISNLVRPVVYNPDVLDVSWDLSHRDIIRFTAKEKGTSTVRIDFRGVPEYTFVEVL